MFVGRLIALCGLIAVAVMAATGCGDTSSSSDEIVARVAGVGTITKAALDHWMPVEATVLYQEVPARPVPKGVIPDPPNYTACIAYLKTVPQKLVESGPKPTSTQLKIKCDQKQKELKELTLNTLIDWDWTIGTGLALGMKVSDAEVRQRLAAVIKAGALYGPDVQKYLKLTGQTSADLLLRSKVQLFEVKISQKVTEAGRALPKGQTAQQRQRALANLTQHSRSVKQWAAMTSCRAGYVVSACRQYRGSETPGLPN